MQPIQPITGDGASVELAAPDQHEESESLAAMNKRHGDIYYEKWGEVLTENEQLRQALSGALWVLDFISKRCDNEVLAEMARDVVEVHEQAGTLSRGNGHES